jgi:hypothetical protein
MQRSCRPARRASGGSIAQLAQRPPTRHRIDAGGGHLLATVTAIDCYRMGKMPVWQPLPQVGITTAARSCPERALDGGIPSTSTDYGCANGLAWMVTPLSTMSSTCGAVNTQRLMWRPLADLALH